MNNPARPSILVYDAEIQKGILGRDETPRPGFEYCAGWTDHAGMGLAVMCAYDYLTDRYRVFGEENLAEFAALCAERDLLVGFNNIGFDNKLCAANGVGVPEEKCYDLLAEVWASFGKRKRGYKLEYLAQTNLGEGKTGDGAQAPLLWQRGAYGAVIDYCLNDVRLTRDLLNIVRESGQLLDPNGGPDIRMSVPAEGRPASPLEPVGTIYSTLEAPL